MTNFSQDYTTLYHNDGDGLFTDVSFRSGLAATLGRISGGASGSSTSTTTACSTSSSPTATSIPTSNGLARARYRQRNQVFRNVGGGRFRHVTDEIGGPLLVEKSSRGAAFGDFDNDGDIDVLVSVLDDRPTLLRNDTNGRALDHAPARRHQEQPLGDRREGDGGGRGPAARR